MDVISNKSENGNEDLKWAIEFTNLAIAITFVQWLSTLSRYLGDVEWLGWILTASFAVIYVFLLVFTRKVMSTPPYFFRSWRELRYYNICWVAGLIPIFLFIPITRYCCLEVLNWEFTLCVCVAVGFWMFVTCILLPSLLFPHNERREAICG